jgi:hypothetical protein
MMKKIYALIMLLCLIPVGVFGQGLPLKDGDSSTLADVAACGSVNCLQSTGPTTASGAGFQGLTGTTGSGATATNKRFNPIYGSEGGGLRAAIPHMLWDDTFNATAQNTGKYNFTSTSMTGAQAGGVFITNNSGLNSININCALQTWKTFPLFAKAELRVNFSALKVIAPQTNETIEMGLMRAVGGAAPTDGVFFRWNTSAELRGVVNYNGTETQTAAITSPSIAVNHDYTIVIQTNTVYFMIDDSVVGTITLLTDAPGQGQPMMAATVPLTIRHYHGGTGPTLTTQRLQVSDVFITVLGPELVRNWETQKAGFGHMAYQGQNGGTMGSTANYANSANPTAAVPTNTTAALGVGLGGQFWETVTLAANADGIIQSFQNPTGTVNQTPRNLIILGVTYSAYNQVALATVAFNKQQSLAFGHTLVSLATGDSASFATPSTSIKAPRRIALGVIQPIAVVNTAYVQYTVRFQAPIVIAPGEFIALVSKNVGTVPATGVIAWMITYDAYFE